MLEGVERLPFLFYNLVMQIDFCSDVHVDNHCIFDVNVNDARRKRAPKAAVDDIRRLIDRIIPDKIGKVLIVAGDVGERLGNNFLFFREMKKIYEYIVVVAGNHDLFLHNHEIVQYQCNSFLKLKHTKELMLSIGVEYMDGWTRNIDGKIIGGYPLLYDNHYAISNFGFDDERCKVLWANCMPDATYIRDGENGLFDYLAYTNSQREKMKLSYQKCDVIFTHVAPILKNLPVKYIVPESTFWQFESSEFLKNCAGKIWIYGHTHTSYDYVEQGCQMFCNPIGYGDQNPSAKIQSFEI